MSQLPTTLMLPLFAAAALLAMPALKAADAAGLDANGDGLVSSTEADYDPKLRADFKKLDVNGDGRLDNSEISGLGAAPPPAAVLVEENRPNYDGPGNTGGGTGGAATGGTASSGPGVPSAPGLPSGGGSVSAPGGAAPSAGSAGTRGGGRR